MHTERSSDGDAARQVLQRAVEAEWRDAQTVEAWARWHDTLAEQGAALTGHLIEHAAIVPGMRVLDLASGTGDPAIPIARRVGPSGRVTATDLSAGMLDAARRNAERAGLSNLSFRQADVTALPFDDASFDAVTCRLGAMYFVQLERALAEIRRVLVPGGRAAFAVWGPADRGSYAKLLLGPLFARRPPPLPPPGAPHPLRFAEPGSLAAALHAASFGMVRDESLEVPFVWPLPIEKLWESFYELAVPMRPYLDGFSAEEHAAARRESIATLPAGRDPARTEMTAAINYASGAA